MLAPPTLVLIAACGGGKNVPSDDTTYTIEQLQDPVTCKECHPRQYQQWSGSMHAYAADDPLFLAMNRRGQKEATIGDFCVKCHAPLALELGETKDGLNLAELPQRSKGVTCYFCHQVDRVDGSHNNPLHLAKDVTMRGQIPDPVKNKAHRSQYSPLHDGQYRQSAGMCGSCHDLVNTHDVHLERTFSEWQESVFSTVYGNTCNQCHMRAQHNQLAAEGPDTPGVGLRTVHDHMSPGIDVALTPWPETDAQRAAIDELLFTSLRTAVCVQGYTGHSIIWIIADSVHPGHGFPSGASQDRRVWFEVRAYDGNDAVIYESGKVPEGRPPTELQDPDLWLLRDCMLDEQGNEVHDFWKALSTDNAAIPSPASTDPLNPLTYQSHVTREFAAASPLEIYPARVTATIWIQAFPLDVFDDLFPDEDPTKQTMRAKLAPVKVLEQTWTADDATNEHLTRDPLKRLVLPMSCKSDRGLSGGADTVRAPKHTRCSP